MSDAWQEQMADLGAFIRRQRQLNNLSLRQLAALTTLSNPYLSQLERGLHQPSLRALKLIADALQLSPEELLAYTGMSVPDTGEATVDGATSVESAIRADQRLSQDQKVALIGVYRTMVGE